VSTEHYNAEEYFARDVGGLVKFFSMKVRGHAVLTPFRAAFTPFSAVKKAVAHNV
jgi:RIO-like serine/threonine protein kinase